ncbi:MAG: patatin-like phospholipase family protein [Stappiaceae bacterium]
MRYLSKSLNYILVTGCLAGLVFALSAYIYNQNAHYQSELKAWPPAEFFAKPVLWKPDNPKVVRVLTIDGGALHGLASLEVLKGLEEESGRPISDLFDFIAGTSTGAIIATTILMPNADGKPKYSVDEVIGLYRDLSEQIMDVPFYHTALTLNGLLGPRLFNHTRFLTADNIYENKKFGELLRPAMIPVFSQDRSAVQLFFNVLEPDANLFLGPIVSAATSFPSFFPAVQLSGYNEHAGIYADGGLVLNDPSLVAYLRAVERSKDAEFIVVSIGGNAMQSVSAEESVEGGFLAWLHPIFSMVFRGQAEINTDSLSVLENIGSPTRLKSFRLEPRLSANWHAFDSSKENITRISNAGVDYVNRNKQTIAEIAELLTRDQADKSANVGEK